jgi:hypothetical protein
MASEWVEGVVPAKSCEYSVNAFKPGNFFPSSERKVGG